MELNQGDLDRFFSYVKKDEVTGCWEWIGARFSVGYGMFCKKSGRVWDELGKRKTWAAHRISWQIHNNGQEIPVGMFICHTCDNRGCVNPAHLYCGTPKQNNTDTIVRNRGNRRKGTDCPWTRITPEMARFIKSMEWKFAGHNQASLAKSLGLHQSHVSMIISGRRWKHI